MTNNKKRKVAIVHVIESVTDSYGGPARSVPTLCLGLSKLGIENVVISIDNADAKNDILDRHKDITWIKSKPSNIKLLSKYHSFELKEILTKKIKELKLDFDVVMHLHSIWSFPSYVFSKTANNLDVPYVVSPRSSMQYASMQNGAIKKKIAKTLIINPLIEKSSRVHVTSTVEDREILNQYPSSKTYRVENALDFSEFEKLPCSKTSKDNFDLPSDIPCFLFFSRVARRKGLDILYSCFKDIVLNEKMEISLLIAGPLEEPNILENILEDAKKSGVLPLVKYVGMLTNNERKTAFAAADIMALPTEFENFGNVIAEAMSAGLPVITTDNTPWQEEGMLGYCILTDRSESSFESAMLGLLNSPLDTDTKERMKQHMASKFNFIEVAEKMKTEYMEVLFEVS